VKIDPYVSVDGLPFSTRAEGLCARLGPPVRTSRNEVALNEMDYGHAVFRFQDNGRLEEITQRGAVVHLGAVAVPFAALAAFIAEHDPGQFERAGYVVSPRFGLAFVPGQPPWVTALARHCIDSWRALRPGGGG
jgi:hypothetical protein